MWDDLIVPQFTLSTDPYTANVKFSNTTKNIGYAHAYYPGYGDTAYGSVWFNPNYNASWGTNNLTPPTIGEWGWAAFVHETGHSIGLNHPGTYNGGSPTYANDAIYTHDSQQYTIMSYFTADNTGADWVGSDGHTYYAQTPMIDDIMTIQAMYGADYTTRADNTVYGFNSNITGITAQIYDFNQNAHPVIAIWDGGGNDTLDLSGWNTPSLVNLNPGTFSNANAMTSNISIARDAWIENAVTGNGNDTLIGNMFANILTGNGGDDSFTGAGGNDTIFAGAGIDTVYYANIQASYVITWDGVAFTVVDSSAGSPDGTDIVKDAEKFSFSGQIVDADTLKTVTPASSYAIAASGASSDTENDGSFTFTVTRSVYTDGAGAVDYAVAGSGNNPADGSDFNSPLTGTVSFADGETSKNVTVNFASDATYEPNEGFTVTLSNPSDGGSITTASVAGTILNDDPAPPPQPSLSIAATTAILAEGNSGTTAYTFTVARTGDTSAASSASWTVSGAAVDAADFGGTLPSGTVDFAAGQASQDITVNVAGDTTVEGNEVFTVTLSNASGATIGTASANGTIVNDDASLSIAATSASKAEGDSGTTAYTFTVTRTGDTSSTSSASWTVSGAAVDAADFGGTLPSGTVDFAESESTATITVLVSGDTVIESNEGFTVTLSNASGATIGTASANGTIVNDDVASSTNYTGTAGNDVINLSGSSADNIVDISQGGNDAVTGGSGNETILLGATLTSSDTINGGSGNDTVVLQGNYASGLSFSNSTMTNVETLKLESGFNYKLVLNNTSISGSSTLTVDASALSAANIANIDGSGVRSGSIVFLGGAGADVFEGGRGSDTFNGGGGADIMNGGRSADNFVYTQASDSLLQLSGSSISTAGADTIVAFATSQDTIDLTAFGFGTNGNFVVRSTNGFTGSATAGFFGAGNEVAVEYGPGNTARVYVDEGDGALGAGDMMIQLTGVANGSLTANDFKF